MTPVKKFKKKTKAPKITAVNINVDEVGDFATEVITDELPQAEELSKFHLSKDCPMMVSIHDLETSPKAKTITVVAKVGTWTDTLTGLTKHYTMENGRLGAQVGHAVSKLKLSYLMWHHPKNLEHVSNWLIDNPITSIILEARDSNELTHIIGLLELNHVHYVEFFDTNKAVYGADAQVLTAIAIGPLFDWMVEGITDYLYLWKSPESPVG